MSIADSVRAAYRRAVPERVRRPAADLRRYAAARRRGDPAAREHLAALWEAVGRPVRRARLADGSRLWVDVRDRGVGRPLYVTGEFEPDELAFLRSRLRPGMTVVDVGANVGLHAVTAARLVGPTGRVVAFEPDPHNLSLLRRNAARLPWVDVRPAAASDRPGRLALYRSDTNFGDHRLTPGDGRGVVSVEAQPLDAALSGLGRVDLLKLDVQGHEARVFAGMARRLESDPPRTVLMEYWPLGVREAGDDPGALLDLLAGAGYSFRALLGGGGTRPVGRGGVEALVPPVPPARPEAAYASLVLAYE